ncbi:MAG: hypothetical protein D6812_13995, partial [Deltaproteobacteria bacterium]
MCQNKFQLFSLILLLAGASLFPLACGDGDSETTEAARELSLDFGRLPCGAEFGEDLPMIGPVPQIVANAVDRIEILFLDSNRRCALKNPPPGSCPPVMLLADTEFALIEPVELDVPSGGSKTIRVELVGKSTRNPDDKHVYLSGAVDATVFDDPTRPVTITVPITYKDSDLDGFADYCEDPQGSGRDTDGDGRADYDDDDSDNDDVPDNLDACLLERARIDENRDGCDDENDLFPDAPFSFHVRLRPRSQPPEIQLTWVAPGDDGDPEDCASGPAKPQRVRGYEIVCNDGEITEQNFDALLGSSREIPYDADKDGLLDTPKCPGDPEALVFTFAELPGCTERGINTYAIRA